MAQQNDALAQRSAELRQAVDAAAAAAARQLESEAKDRAEAFAALSQRMSQDAAHITSEVRRVVMMFCLSR